MLCNCLANCKQVLYSFLPTVEQNAFCIAFAILSISKFANLPSRFCIVVIIKISLPFYGYHVKKVLYFVEKPQYIAIDSFKMCIYCSIE